MKIHHLKYLGFLPALVSCGQGGEKTTDSPSLDLPKLPHTGKPRNVVFILSDDHRYDFMGFLFSGRRWICQSYHMRANRAT